MRDDALALLSSAVTKTLKDAAPDLAGSVTTILVGLTALAHPLAHAFVAQITRGLLQNVLKAEDTTRVLVTSIAAAPFFAALNQLNEAMRLDATTDAERQFRSARCLQALGNLDLAEHQAPDSDRMMIVFFKGIAAMQVPGGADTAKGYLQRFIADSADRAEQLRVLGQRRIQRASLVDPRNPRPPRKLTSAEQCVTFSDGFMRSPEHEQVRPIGSRTMEGRFDKFLDEQGQTLLRIRESEQLRRDGQTAISQAFELDVLTELVRVFLIRDAASVQPGS